MSAERRPNAFQLWLQWLASTAFGRWLLPRSLYLADRFIYRLTGGRKTLASLMTGVPVLMLTTRGAKSGVERTIPLLGIPQDEKFILIASNFGQHHFPGWYYNLRAYPQARIAINGKSSPYTAREVTDEKEYRQCWEQALAVYKGYDIYKAVAGRRIPVFLLEPKSV